MTVARPEPALSRLPRGPLYERVVDRLRAHVEQAGLKPGDRLPSERQLAEALGVSRNSVRQATVALEVQGLVEVRHGGGTYLRVASLQPESLDRVVDRRRRLPDILDAREALETKIAALAAGRRTPEDLAALDEAVALMAGRLQDVRESDDEAFHRALTRAAHAPILAQMMAELADEFAISRREALRQPSRPARLLDEHRAIAAAVRDGDPAAAGAAMEAHLATVRDVKLLAWDPEAP